jgi:hypothetical protein
LGKNTQRIFNKNIQKYIQNKTFLAAFGPGGVKLFSLTF